MTSGDVRTESCSTWVRQPAEHYYIRGYVVYLIVHIYRMCIARSSNRSTPHTVLICRSSYSPLSVSEAFVVEESRLFPAPLVYYIAMQHMECQDGLSPLLCCCRYCCCCCWYRALCSLADGPSRVLLMLLLCETAICRNNYPADASGDVFHHGRGFTEKLLLKDTNLDFQIENI